MIDECLNCGHLTGDPYNHANSCRTQTTKPQGWSVYPPQDPLEFERLCSIVRELRPRSILEVGSRHGRSLIRFAEAAMPGLRKVTSIDMPGGPWGHEDSAASLINMLRRLEHRGVEVDYHLENSHGEAARLRAKSWAGNFDFIFLDGDHRLEGIKADFEIYWPCLAPDGVMAIHDIAGCERPTRRDQLVLGVPQFWRELTTPPGAVKQSLVTPGKNFGIGVLYANAEVLQP